MLELPVPAVPQDVIAAVECCAKRLSLSIAFRSTLRKYPGSLHWHLKRPGRRGTLEVTHWPVQQRLWVSYHRNRACGGWVSETATEMAAALAEIADQGA